MSRRWNPKWTAEMGAYEAVYLEGKPACAKRARALIGGARARAKRKKLPCSLDVWSLLSVQAVLERGKCELTGIEFGEGPFAPTLDRIEPARGYAPGNVRVVCKIINAALGNWGESVLREAMGAWLKNPQPAGSPAPFSLRDLHRNRLFD